MKHEPINNMDLSLLRKKIMDKKINFSPSYQRNGGIWSEEKQLLFIDSILRGYVLPTIYFLKRDDDVWDVIDGLQRLSTILNYCGISDEAEVKKLNFSDYNIKGFGKLNDRKCTEFLKFHGADYTDYGEETVFIENLQKFKIPYIVLYDTNEQELKDIFCRLNSGEQLSKGEWLNGLISTLPIWQITKKFSNDIVQNNEISRLIYVKHKLSRQIYSEFDVERKMDVWFWANISLTIYKNKKSKKNIFISGKSGVIFDEFEALQLKYQDMSEKEKENEQKLANDIYDEMKQCLTYFTKICRHIPDDAKHSKAYHTIFLYVYYLKSRNKLSGIDNYASLHAKKIGVFFDNNIDENNDIYIAIKPYIESYRNCGSRNDASTREKRYRAFKEIMNL